MADWRILTTHRPLDGPDELEDLWLKARESVMAISQLETPEQIDNDSTQLIVQHAHRGKHEEIQLGLCSIYLSINNPVSVVLIF